MCHVIVHSYIFLVIFPDGVRLLRVLREGAARGKNTRDRFSRPLLSASAVRAAFSYVDTVIQGTVDRGTGNIFVLVGILLTCGWIDPIA